MQRNEVLEKLARYNLAFKLATNLIELYRLYEERHLETEKSKIKSMILGVLEFEEFNEKEVEEFKDYLLVNLMSFLKDPELKTQIEIYSETCKQLYVLNEILNDEEILSAEILNN